MNVKLSPRYEALIRQKVETGDYADASEVLDEALRLMDERDRMNRLQAALAAGLASIERGDVYELTPELWDKIEREADEADRLGLPLDPDVCP